MAMVLSEIAVAAPRPANAPIRLADKAGGSSPPHSAVPPAGDLAAELEDGAVGARETNAVMPFDDDGPVWPDEATETAMIAERGGREQVVDESGKGNVARRVRNVVERVDPSSLPPLDDLVNRLPTDVRQTLEELFRARFVTVAKAPSAALKQQG